MKLDLLTHLVWHDPPMGVYMDHTEDYNVLDLWVLCFRLTSTCCMRGTWRVGRTKHCWGLWEESYIIVAPSPASARLRLHLTGSQPHAGAPEGAETLRGSRLVP